MINEKLLAPLKNVCISSKFVKRAFIVNYISHGGRGGGAKFGNMPYALLGGGVVGMPLPENIF